MAIQVHSYIVMCLCICMYVCTPMQGLENKALQSEDILLMLVCGHLLLAVFYEARPIHGPLSAINGTVTPMHDN